jgi:hypothetical protein
MFGFVNERDCKQPEVAWSSTPFSWRCRSTVTGRDLRRWGALFS